MSVVDALVGIGSLLFVASLIFFLAGYAKAIALNEWHKESELLRWGALCFLGVPLVGVILLAVEQDPRAGGAFIIFVVSIATGLLFAKWWRRRRNP